VKKSAVKVKKSAVHFSAPPALFYKAGRLFFGLFYKGEKKCVLFFPSVPYSSRPEGKKA